MKDYFIRIIYCGEDFGTNYFFKSNKRDFKGILRDFWILCNREVITKEKAYNYLMCADDVVELLICLNDKKILVSDGEEEF